MSWITRSSRNAAASAAQLELPRLKHTGYRDQPMYKYIQEEKSNKQTVLDTQEWLRRNVKDTAEHGGGSEGTT